MTASPRTRCSGPRSTNEINWAAHDPTTLAENLRGTQPAPSTPATAQPGPLDSARRTPARRDRGRRRAAHAAFHDRLRRCGSRASTTTTAPARTAGPTGRATCSRAIDPVMPTSRTRHAPRAASPTRAPMRSYSVFGWRVRDRTARSGSSARSWARPRRVHAAGQRQRDRDDRQRCTRPGTGYTVTIAGARPHRVRAGRDTGAARRSPSRSGPRTPPRSTRWTGDRHDGLLDQGEHPMTPRDPPGNRCRDRAHQRADRLGPRPPWRTAGPPNLFTTLARHRRLFWPWLLFAGRLMPRGSLPRADTELLILRVAHNCEMRLRVEPPRADRSQRRASAEDVARVREGAGAAGWTRGHEALLLRAADELHAQREHLRRACGAACARSLRRRADRAVHARRPLRDAGDDPQLACGDRSPLRIRRAGERVE